MLLTSQTRVVGQGEVKRLGPVTGEYTIDENIYKAILTEMKDYEEIRTPAYEKELEKAKEEVMDQMTKKTEALGGNAVIGLNMFHEVINFGRAMMIAGRGIAAYIDGLDE
jgi:uncharacterized protein YbjQ (UPF0145 family)